MKRKARGSYEEAQSLVNATPSRWSGAANRAYYALYQALVGEFESKGHTPDKFGPPDKKHPAKWPHSVIRLNCGIVGLDAKEKKVVETAWGVRVKADYKPDPVVKTDVEGILVRIPALLTRLGC